MPTDTFARCAIICRLFAAERSRDAICRVERRERAARPTFRFAYPRHQRSHDLRCHVIARRREKVARSMLCASVCAHTLEIFRPYVALRPERAPAAIRADRADVAMIPRQTRRQRCPAVRPPWLIADTITRHRASPAAKESARRFIVRHGYAESEDHRRYTEYARHR